MANRHAQDYKNNLYKHGHYILIYIFNILNLVPIFFGLQYTLLLQSLECDSGVIWYFSSDLNDVKSQKIIIVILIGAGASNLTYI
jgi:hypothetical protein